MDPLAQQYAYYTPYQFSGNMPIQATDLDGLEPEYEGKENEVAFAKDKDSGVEGEWTYRGADLGWTANTLPEVKVSPPKKSMLEDNYDTYSTVASGVLTVAGELKYSGRFGLSVWQGRNGKFYSQVASKGRIRPFYGNQYTGSINRAKSIARPLKIGGAVLGAINYAVIYNSYEQSELSNIQLAGEAITNTFTTFGGVYGLAWGIGWELGRAITKTDFYIKYIQKNPGGKDGLLTTPE